MKKLFKLLLFLFLAISIGLYAILFRLSDLRSEDYKFPRNQAKAAQLLKEMGDAHNIHFWDSIDTYQVTFGDEFYGFLGKQSNPFKEEKMEFSLSYIPKKSQGHLEILNGKEKGTVWGIQDWQTYLVQSSGNVTIQKDKDMKFWIPTYQYFIEFPNRIQEATVVDYYGESIINDIQTVGVIASWDTVGPQKEIDQYIIWLNAESKQIVKIEYTVREIYGFVTGAAYFQKYKDYDGFLLPTEMPVESNLLKEGFLHQMTLRDFKPNLVSAKALSPLN